MRKGQAGLLFLLAQRLIEGHKTLAELSSLGKIYDLGFSGMC